MRWDFGTILQGIRKAKGITQSQVCGNQLARPTLSKIENNREIPNVENFDFILRQLDMTYAEFDYICHAYRPSGNSRIIYAFEHMAGRASRQECRSLLEECETYLKTHQDYRIQKIALLLRTHLAIQETGQSGQTHALAQRLWQELERSDEWYWSDFRLLQVLVPTLPVESLIELSDKLVCSLEKYRDFKEITDTKFGLLHQLGTLFLDRHLFLECLRVTRLADAVAQKSLQMDYLGLVWVRLGLLEQDRGMVDKGLSVLRLAGLESLAASQEKKVTSLWDVVARWQSGREDNL